MYKVSSTIKTNQHLPGVCQKHEIFIDGLSELYSYISIPSETILLCWMHLQ